MSRPNLRFLFILVLAVACQSVPVPSPRITPTATMMVYPFTPTLTPTPSLTPIPPLAQQGPYLLYRKGKGSEESLRLVDASFQGRKVLDLPKDFKEVVGYYMYDTRHATSPDGKWFAFLTGSSDAPRYDLTLNLLSIPDGAIYPVASLMSQQYSDDLKRIEDFYQQLGCEWGFVDNALHTTLGSFEWSPDSQHLAFSGQMDGPSSDLYIYDLQPQKTRRLTDDLYILNGGFSWSPDGKLLEIQDVCPGLNYYSRMLHFIEADGPMMKSLPVLQDGSWWTGVQWLSPTHYLISGLPDTGDRYDLRSIDVKTGKIQELWHELYFSYAVNSQDMTIAVNGIVGEAPDGSSLADTFVISSNGKRTPLSKDTSWVIGFHGGENPYFVGISNKHLATFDNNGIVIEHPVELDFINNIISSPDGKWFLLFDENGRRPLYVFSDDVKQQKVFSDLDASGVVWRNDSIGFFVAAGGQKLIYVAVADLNPIIVDKCLPDEKDCWFSNYMVWIP